MPIYLDTRGNSVLSVAVCDRCRKKFAYTELYPDPNFPGMRVCKDDLDNFDPWRLPARQTENIALRFPRPDTNIALTPNQLLTESGFTNGNSIFIDGVPPTNAGQGDLNTASNIASVSNLVPAITSISPNIGPLAGGNTVTMYGFNFTDLINVKFAGQIATTNQINSTTVEAVVPAGVITGIVDVTLTTAFGTATAYGGYTYS